LGVQNHWMSSARSNATRVPVPRATCSLLGWCACVALAGAFFASCDDSDGAASTTGKCSSQAELVLPQPDPEPYDSATALERRRNCEFSKFARVSETIGGPGSSDATAIAAGLPDASGIEHVVVLLRENRSFDHYFGCLSNPEIDHPPADAKNWDASTRQDLHRYHETRYCTQDTPHEWSDVHLQLDHGRRDGFVAAANNDANFSGGGRAMGFYDGQDLPFYYWLADTFAISDRYFASVPGPTHPNVSFYFHATACGYTEGVQDSLNFNHNIGVDCGGGAPSIFDRLDHASPPVSSRVYSSNSWFFQDLAASVIIGGYSGDVGDIDQFKEDVQHPESFANVVFVEPSYSRSLGSGGENDEHPPTSVQVGQEYTYAIVDALMRSPVWKSTVLFITWDEHGGLFDHVLPPRACPPDDDQIDTLDFRFDQYGFRVPLLVISPFAKRHYVSKFIADHTSITRFIEYRWDLEALTNRDANAWPLLDMFQFDAPNFDVPAYADPGIQVDAIDSCHLSPAATGIPDGATSACRSWP